MNQKAQLLKFSICLLIIYLNVLFGTSAHTASLPDQSGAVHNGVASCAASTCHGAVRPFTNSNILHNEFITWTRKDRHAKAYRTLLNKKSKQIAKKLGLGAPHKEAICLDCHASNIPKKLRGPKFQLSDGVGCESCHGGSEKWLKSHVDKTTTHAQNIDKGLYPTEDPLQRAELCLSCHYGNNKKFVTHEIMGAGHPRLSFELDTFTELLPPHHNVDADYEKRKTVTGPAKTWMLGQLASVQAILEQISGERVTGNQLFPELSLFDCHSCHHRMSNLRWVSRPTTGLGPGVVRFQDAHMVMAINALKPVDANANTELRKLTRKLHQASTQNSAAVNVVTGKMQTLLPGWIEKVKQHNLSKVDIESIIANLIKDGLKGEYSDYAAAEQTTMAITDLMAELEGISNINEAKLAKLQKTLDAMYVCVENDEKYKTSCFVKNLKILQKNL